MTINPSDVSARLRQLVIMDEVGSDNPLGREAADLLDSQAKLLAEREWRLDIAIKPLEWIRDPSPTDDVLTPSPRTTP